MASTPLAAAVRRVAQPLQHEQRDLLVDQVVLGQQDPTQPGRRQRQRRRLRTLHQAIPFTVDTLASVCTSSRCNCALRMGLYRWPTNPVRTNVAGSNCCPSEVSKIRCCPLQESDRP